MTIANAIASVPVTDIAAATTWYERLLGRQPDSKPTPELAEWTFDRGGGLQVYALPARAGGGSVTLAVTDLDAQIEILRHFRIEPGQVITTDQARVVMVKDPDGNSLAFAQPRSDETAG